MELSCFVPILISVVILRFFENQVGWSAEGNGVWLVFHVSRLAPEEAMDFLASVSEAAEKFYRSAKRAAAAS